MTMTPMGDRRSLMAFLDDCTTRNPSHGFVGEGGEMPYEFELDDLYHLYCTVRQTSCVSVLEFGSGWSTAVLAMAVYENSVSFGDIHRADVRHPNPFQLLTVDVSGRWQEIAVARIPEPFSSVVRPHVSSVTLGMHDGTYCHVYTDLPAFVADLIYVDGPDPEQVSGLVNGFAYSELHSLPMGADLLRMEPHLWPGTKIVTDGRTANARFLADRLRRQWQVMHDPFGDRTTFRLEETSFGPVSEQHVAIRLAAARALLEKEPPS